MKAEPRLSLKGLDLHSKNHGFLKDFFKILLARLRFKSVKKFEGISEKSS